MAMIKRGPVVITAASIGYLTAGLVGALVATVAIVTLVDGTKTDQGAACRQLISFRLAVETH